MTDQELAEHTVSMHGVSQTYVMLTGQLRNMHSALHTVAIEALVPHDHPDDLPSEDAS